MDDLFETGAGFAHGSLEWREHVDDLVFGINKRQAEFIKGLVDKYGVKSVLDVPCGNGDAAILLAGWGNSVAALEQDSGRVKRVQLKSITAGVQIKLACGDMRDLSSIYKDKYNLITCLRNSLPRLLNEADIWGTLAQMYLRLEPAGILIIQTLDYDRLFKENVGALPARHAHYSGLDINVMFERGRGNSNARFILKVSEDCAGRKKEAEFAIPVRPIFQKELNIWLAELGFERIENHGGLTENSTPVETWETITVAFRPDSPGHH